MRADGEVVRRMTAVISGHRERNSWQLVPYPASSQFRGHLRVDAPMNRYYALDGGLVLCLVLCCVWEFSGLYDLVGDLVKFYVSELPTARLGGHLAR
jgi:hypothetical protein